MLIKLKNVNVNYERYGEGKETIVFLHGWGQNIEMMMPIAKPFFKTNDVIIVDLPGHGQSEEPDFPWNVEDYVELIKSLLDSLKVKNPIMIGHSFGGKVTLLYASKYKCKKIVLLASPFKKEIAKESLKLKVLKKLKQVPGLNKFEEIAKKYIGSTDYKNATPTMRKVLVNTVNLDITEDVKKIKCPALIIWGTNDEAVDVERAYELEKLIEDSGVVIYENCTHYAYLENLKQTINVLKSFIL